MKAADLAARVDRGLLLDLTVFALNLVLVRALAGRLVDLARAVSAGDAWAQWMMAAFFAAMFVLPAAGAVLTRWHFHRRRGARDDDASAAAFGCLLNPAFYFAVSVTIATTAGVLVAQRLFGDDVNNRAEVFLPMIFGVMVLTIVQTMLVYRWFDPPQRPPGAFLRGPWSKLLGDACIFVNAILFQVLWSLALAGRFNRLNGIEDFLGRLFFLWFLSILVYFPPRIFYLAEDAGRRGRWLTMLLATSPVVLHVLGII